MNPIQHSNQPEPALEAVRGLACAGFQSSPVGVGGRPSRRPCRPVTRTASMVLFLGLCLCLGQGVEPGRPFHFGFSSSLMDAVGENEARAAMKVWAESIVKSGAVRADPNVVYCRDLASLLAALQGGTVDGMALLTPEFFILRDRVEFTRCIVASTEGKWTDEYLLLVRKDAGSSRIEDLAHKSLLLEKNPRLCMAIPWLDTMLVRTGLKPAREYFSRVAEESKLTKTVLPVFFGQVDACIVTRKGYNAMVALNPQVGTELRVLAASPELVSTGFFFRKGYPPDDLNRCMLEFTRVHTTPSGQQILTVFLADRLDEHPFSDLEATAALWMEHNRLCGAPVAGAATGTTGDMSHNGPELKGPASAPAP